MTVPIPIAVANILMGGVDKSDQLLFYHNVLHCTVCYWKTLFYHGLDVGIVNSFILYNLLAYQSGMRTITENDFRDMEGHRGVLIMSTMGALQLTTKGVASIASYPRRKYPDCPLAPSLCQTLERDCHAAWHKSLLILMNLEHCGLTKQENKSRSFSSIYRDFLS